MGCRIECAVDKKNTCCCLECEKYEECPDYVKEDEDE